MSYSLARLLSCPDVIISAPVRLTRADTRTRGILPAARHGITYLASIRQTVEGYWYYDNKVIIMMILGYSLYYDAHIIASPQLR